MSNSTSLHFKLVDSHAKDSIANMAQYFDMIAQTSTGGLRVLLGAPSKIAGAPSNSMKYPKYPSFKK